MKKLLRFHGRRRLIILYLAIFLCFFILNASADSVPTNPMLSMSVTGTTVNLSWSADNADTYILYAAPYPDASVIYDFDMGNQTSGSFDLPVDSAFYVAVRASNNAGISDWSNIEYFDLSLPADTLSESDYGKTIYLSPGDKVILTLDSNPTTGYVWGIKALKEAVFLPTEHTYTSTCSGLGGGGYEMWTFTSVGKGFTQLEMVYYQPWTEIDNAIINFFIEIIVQ